MTRRRPGRSGVPIPLGVRDYSLFQNIQTVSGAHLASWVPELYPGGKAAGA